jgi:flavin-dependent dehydrogenase
LENYLATRARAHGVNLLERASVRALDPARGGFRFRTDATEGEASAVVCAFGKRSSLDAALALPRSHRPGAYAAIKTYFEARPEALEADVELHLVPGGYVGLNPVEGGRIGLCALLDGEPTRDFAALSLRFARNPTLADRLSRLRTPSTPIRGLARFGFQAQRLLHVDAKRVALFCGDAARLVPSFTGDGNAIAIRSGRLAAANLAAGTPHEYARAFETHFAWRFRAAAALHRAFLHPALFDLAAPLLSAQPALLDRLYAWTRGQ